MSRKLDLSAFRGDDSDGEEPGPIPKVQVSLTDLKSRTFSHGITKKSKKDLEREAEEKKRVEEEKEAARVLAEYSEAFDAPSSTSAGPGMRAFGGPRGGFVRAGGAPVTAAPMPSGPAAMQGFLPPKGPAAMGYSRFGRPPPRAPSPEPVVPKPKGKRAMDAFLEEIKGNQANREQRLGEMAKQEGSSVSALAAREAEKNGRAFSDAESTNLFVSNLPANITEESLGMFFAKQGPVGTVKIMWPRGEEEIAIARRNGARLTGFVSYMKRKAAESAVNELDGFVWGGNQLRVGWSKPVPMPAKAIYDLGLAKDRDRSPRRRNERDRYASGSRDRSSSPSRSPSPAARRARRSGSYSSSSSSRSSSPPRKPTAREKWLATVPPETSKFIKAVAQRVRDHGKEFEEVLRTRERDNPKFAFLLDETKPEYHLYRLSVNRRYRVPTPPPDKFEDEGYASLYSSDSAEDSEKERTAKGKVGRLARKRFEAMLRAMSGKRAEIARAMEFAMLRAEAADELCDLICQSLLLDDTPVPRKIARLHLVSDILHNSASPMPNVWRYRLAFEKRLPEVFAHLGGVERSLRAYKGRIGAEVFRAQVLGMLSIWERWIVFTQDVSDKYKALFDGTQSLDEGKKPLEAEQDRQDEHAQRAEAEAKKKDEEDAGLKGFKSGGFKSSFKPLSAAAAAVKVEEMPGLKGEEDDDVDGEAMDMDDEDLDGEKMDGGGGGEDEDLDGEAMDDDDDDLDGEAM